VCGGCNGGCKCDGKIGGLVDVEGSGIAVDGGLYNKHYLWYRTRGLKGEKEIPFVH